MGWLSKIILNGVEMLIKDSYARTELEKFAGLWNGKTGETNYHVSPSGSDETGDGSEEAPFATIQHAYDTAIAYAMTNHNAITLFIHAGEYYENVSIGSTFKANRVIIDLLGNVGLHGSFVVTNTRVEIVGRTDNEALTIYGDISTQNIHGNSLVVCVEFGELLWNSKGSLIGLSGVTAVEQAILVENMSRFYQGYKTYIRGNYVYNIINVYRSDANLNSDVTAASAPAVLHSEYSTVFSLDPSVTG